MYLEDFDPYNEQEKLELKKSIREKTRKKLLSNGLNENIMDDILSLLLLGKRDFLVEAENILNHFDISDLELSSCFEDSLFLDELKYEQENNALNNFDL